MQELEENCWMPGQGQQAIFRAKTVDGSLERPRAALVSSFLLVSSCHRDLSAGTVLNMHLVSSISLAPPIRTQVDANRWSA